MKKIFYLILSVIISLVFTTCDKQSIKDENIEDESLVYSVQYFGGWTSIDEVLKISEKTTYFSSSYYSRDKMKRVSYQITKKTPKEIWDNLNKTYKLETFKKIKDGSCSACLDGVDETFTVTLFSKTYSLYNGVKDENYKQMQDFFDLFYEQIKAFRDNAEYK